MPISRDMAIFVLTTTTAQPITLPHAQGVIITPWVLPRVKNETQGVFSMSYIILSHLLILLSLRCLDLLIFMLTDDRRQSTDCFTPCCVCVHTEATTGANVLTTPTSDTPPSTL